jgi:ankyrin repeat protein
VLEEKKEFIVAWFQQAFESGDFEERSDRGNDSDAEVSGDRRYKGKEVVIEERYVNNDESPAKRANYLVPPSPTRPRGRKLILPDFPPPSYTDSTVSRPSKSPQISIHEVSSLETPVEDTRFSQPPLIKRSTSLTARLTHSLLHSKDALLKAVTSGDIGKAKSLVEMGHDVNYLSRQSEMTPLFVAATQNNYKMVKWLLEAGADPSTPGIFGYRALHRAVVGEGDDVVETVRLLLDHGADPSLVTDEGQTTLHCAVNVRKPNISVLRMLLEYGTPIGAVATGSTGSGQMVVLVDHLSVVIQNESMTALHIAVVQNNLSTVRLLLENGADPGRAPAATSTTALHLAAEYGSLHMVQLLLKHTAGLELVDRGGRTALIIATMHGKVDVIQLLLQYGADATAKDKSGRTPLYWARKLPTAQSMALLLIERGITARARGAS